MNIVEIFVENYECITFIRSFINLNFYVFESLIDSKCQNRKKTNFRTTAYSRFICLSQTNDL